MRQRMPDIYHITHLDNVSSIVECGCLWSDAERVRQGLDHENVGLTEIKQCRLSEREVKCHPGTMVGEYVPFYFCPRSIMLYLLHRGNRPGLTYAGGQRPIVHLVADMAEVVGWAEAQDVRWAFSDRNAGAAYADFFCDVEHLDRIQWDAVHASDFRDSRIKDGKQAEFLLHQYFPWELIQRIGVIDALQAETLGNMLSTTSQKPIVEVQRGWYY